MAKGSIIWTRAKIYHSEDKDIIKDPDVVAIPCLEFEEIEIPKVIPAYRDIIITSQQCLPFIQNHQKLSGLVKKSHIHTFGHKTAKVMEPNSKKVTRYDEQNAKGMIMNIIRADCHGPFLYIGPKDPSFPIVESLKKAGIRAEHLSIYETKMPKTKRSIDQNHLKGVVCFSSPKTVENFIEMFKDKDISDLWAVSIGSTTEAQAAGYFNMSFAAPQPSSQALYISAQKLLSKWKQAAVNAQQ